ncbi:uncharacterized protein BJ171DRAFT_522603 [Polychytrium aggregatum]|uniref:uncharacterized protein n=1 Tax=Polychytrium aggregatum TaxID=110093 RepID=UPI0022FEE918|nr:uncharacterized protein BJ171DRAFT_522603 [Polychytrium aggregatum]KAI9197102.1 hypothetical protein BJ171DRAFT_522603 [Polychytrium aggregatum]
MAPEMLDDDDPSDTTMKTDVYAFAITVYEVLNDAKPVWATASGQAMKPFQILVQLLQHKRPKRIGDIPDNVWALIERCWAHDPADRPSFPDILDVLQPYNRAPVPQSSSIAAPSRAISDTAVPDVNSRSQPSRSGELWFDGIDSVVRLPGLLVAHAKQGDPEACLDAAKFISDGLLARHSDWKLAAQLFKAAADRGNLEACFSLAWLHLTGEGIHQDDRSALWYWQEVSTKSGDQAIKSIATHMVGWMHYLGRGTIRDEQKGISIIRYNESKAFPLGEHDGLATYRLTSDDSLASRKFFGLCQSGSGQDWLCKHLMAVCLVQGFGTPKDQRRAFGLLEELAGRGHSDSQFWVGECCFWGRGVPWNYSRAFEWLSKSADQGNSYGQWMLGRFYASGWGVDEDKPKGAGWFRRSAERGNRYGQYELGHCYNRGSGVAQSIDTAAFWFRKSADQGFDAAANSLKDIGK